MNSPFQIQGLDHIVLRITDLERSRYFYETVLGCSMERELPELGLYQLRAGSQLIDLVPIGTQLGGDSPVSDKGRNQDHFCISIDPFDESALREYLAAHDIDASEAAERYGAEGYGLSIYITDPDGNVVELKGGKRIV